MSDQRDLFFSILNETVKHLGEPYYSEPTTRFLFKKGNGLLHLNLSPRGFSIEAYVASSGIYLELSKLSSFCNALKEIDYAPLTVEISTYFTNKTIFSVFPRMEISSGLSADLSTNMNYLNDEIDKILETLDKLEKVIIQYRAYDKSSEAINKLWQDIQTSSNKQTKGKKLEEILSLMVGLTENFRVIDRNIRTRSEEVDLLIENLGKLPFFSQLNSPLILVECKNWVSKVSAKHVRDFAQKLQNRNKMICNIGILVSITGITKDATEELIGYRGKDFLIVLIDGSDLIKVVQNKLNFEELLKDSISKAAMR